MENLIPDKALIKLNNIPYKNEHKILFILAGLEGNCDIFKDLCEKLEEKCIQVFGLQFSKQVPLESVNKMALFYMKIVDSVCPNQQDIYLAGYSFGGLIAIEIARILEERVRELFLFEASHLFFKVAAHQNFQLFKHAIVEDNFLNYPHVFKAVLSIYLLNFIGMSQRKYELYDYLVECVTLDDSLDKSIEFLIKHSLFEFDDTTQIEQFKYFLRVLILKSAAGYVYNYPYDFKLLNNIHLFKSKKFIYPSIQTSDYANLKNSIRFNLQDYSLNEICSKRVHVYEFDVGNHWNFINENIDDICSFIDRIINRFHAKL